ncbi:hypothetical protein EC988_000385 [Linderina pennispora]|nr:hypothetical protein EC988_000385 [Linderina pennispora]
MDVAATGSNAALDTSADPLAGWEVNPAVDTSADWSTDPAAASNNVGNSVANIDSSTNIINTEIEYPDDTQMTDNTGTAVSGNNNDVMPIINAPVTVIVNEAPSNHQQANPAPVAPWEHPPGHPNASQVAGQQPPAGTPLQQQPPVDPFTANIQNLIAYALALRQSQLQPQ